MGTFVYIMLAILGCALAGCAGNVASATPLLPPGPEIALSRTHSSAAAMPLLTTMQNPAALYVLGDLNATLTDSGPGHVNGSYGSGVSHGSAALTNQGGTASTFPGVASTAKDIAQTPAAALLEPAAAMSLSVWFSQRASATATKDTHVAGYGPSDSYGYALRLSGKGNALKLDIRTAHGYAVVQAHAAVPLGAIAYGVATYDGTFARLYLNGKLQGSVAASGAVVYSANPAKAGLAIGGPHAQGPAFNGTLQDVAVYSRALSATDVATIYTALSSGGASPPPSASPSPSASAPPKTGATPPALSGSYSNTSLPPVGWDPLVTHGPPAAFDASRINWPAICEAPSSPIACSNGDPAYASNSAAIIAQSFPHGSAGLLGWCTTQGYTARYNGAQGSQSCQGHDTMSSVFFASNNDPSYKIACVTYGSCGAGNSGNGSGSLQGQTVHIANGSTPNLGGDAHLLILNEQANLDCEFWNTENARGKPNPLSGGGSLNIGNGSCGSLTSAWDGTPNIFVAYGSSVEMVRFLVRPEELLAHNIPHALYMSLSNNKPGHVWPAPSDDGSCTGNANNAQQGEVIYLDTAGYNALLNSSASVLKKTFLRVFHEYGVYDLDSSGCGSPSANYSNFLGWDPLLYTQNGLTNPWDSVLATRASDPDRANDWSQNGDYNLMNLDLSDTALNASNFHILAPALPQCVVTGQNC